MNCLLYAVQLDSHVNYHHLMNTLHETERLRVSRLTRHEDQLNSLISVILIKFLLHKHFNVMSVIQRTLYGRPFVEDKLWNGDFNISHSGRVVVCAMNPAGKVGVDVEQITTLDLTIVEHCLSEFELMQWKQPHSISEQLKLFYRFWTLKESYLKQEGTGMAVIPLNSIEFTMVDEFSSKLLQHHDLNFCTYTLRDDYVISFCYDTKAPPPKLTIIHLHDLLANY